MKIKKYINGNVFINHIRSCFERIPDHRSCPEIPIEDALMSGFALFQLKFPSLLKFEEKRKKDYSNFNRIFKIKRSPSDTRMREIIDPVETNYLRLPFKKIFSSLQNSKVLEGFKFYQDYVLISSDGTGVHSSQHIQCECCLEKYNKKSKEVTYYHQCLTAAMVHPNKKVVIPFAPEIIKKEDGFSKNDCEINASKRLWTKFRQDHPRLKAIVLEDALYANAPHIMHLRNCQLNFIITVKKTGHKSLYEAIKKRESGLKDVYSFSKVHEEGIKIKKSITRIYKFVNQVPLNQTANSPGVNFISFKELTIWKNSKGELQQNELNYSWVTDIEINYTNAERIVQAGRCRWKIENETLNTLKNQGYNFEHNYGHGYKNLSSNFTYLMLLAFLFDQALEGFCDVYKQLREATKTRYGLWEAMRAIFRYFQVTDWNHFLETILKKELNTC